jgi:hypothetical protein
MTATTLPASSATDARTEAWRRWLRLLLSEPQQQPQDRDQPRPDGRDGD